MNAVELHNLSKTYPGGKQAVRDVSLSLEPGEVFGFLGPNGAGKTTTVKLLNGMLRPQRGSAGCWARIRRGSRKRYMQSQESSRSMPGCMIT